MRLIILLLALCTTVHAQDLIAMTYAGPTIAEIDGTLELHRDAIADLQQAVKDLKAEIQSLKNCNCSDCKCVDCKGNCPPKPLINLEELVVPITSSVTLHGKPIDVDAYIAENRGYDAPHWGISGDINAHLRDHGFAGIEGLSMKKRMALHQACHHAGGSVQSTSVRPRTTTVTSGCANGRCQRPSRRLMFWR